MISAARLALAVLAAAPLGPAQQSRPSAAPPTRPNIVVIVSDDAGYADFGIQGNRRFPTPRIDSIARDGVRFAAGYVTASVCSPSRAGLMTGRYPQRFGHEFNIPPRYSETNGLPVSEVTLADVLHDLGYRTIALGKWHLGYAPRFHPLSRGFDAYFGFLQGARSYFPLARPTRLNRLLRDREPVPEDFEYLTDELGKQAAAYIERTRDRPFFLYLAFNAVHTPMHARADVLAQVEGIQRPRRRKLAAMTISLDRAVGRVLDALAGNGLADRTLLFFVNDNGGATTNGSSNAPLRGHKGTPFEGGIRVPFFARWPGELPAGEVYTEPVSTVDILPTAVAAAGGGYRPKHPLDGVDLLPHLRGEAKGPPHRILFWRRGANMAVRQGRWKLLRRRGGPPMLFDLETDPREAHDLAASEPQRVETLLAAYARWEKELEQPRWRRGRRR